MNNKAKTMIMNNDGSIYSMKLELTIHQLRNKRLDSGDKVQGLCVPRHMFFRALSQAQALVEYMK